MKIEKELKELQKVNKLKTPKFWEFFYKVIFNYKGLTNSKNQFFTSPSKYGDIFSSQVLW